MTDQQTSDEEAYEHLQEALEQAKEAKQKFSDGSKGESVADNVVRWADKSVSVAERYLNDQKSGDGNDE